MRLKAAAKSCRPVVLSVDVEEVAVSVEVIVAVAAVVVREYVDVGVGVGVDVEGPLGHLVLFVCFFFTCVKDSR